MGQNSERVIIDTNLWISFLLTSNFTKLDQLFYEKRIVLLFSEELMEEFLTVVARPKLRKYISETDLAALLKQIGSCAEFVRVTSLVNACCDTKDNFLLALAQDGNATHLITGDKDLLDLQLHGQTAILNMTSYLARF
jgi:putative PIN family toxin of toxin-antitoxin system